MSLLVDVVMLTPRRTTVHRVNMGFAYLALLFIVAMLGTLLAVVGTYWHVTKIRDQEQQLLFVGHQFRNAIALYYLRTPDSVKHYPSTLEDLLGDTRYLGAQRYLREIYRDPITNSTEWGTITSFDGGIMGVYSLSNKSPMKQSQFDDEDRALIGAARYSDWKFTFEPPF